MLCLKVVEPQCEEELSLISLNTHHITSSNWCLNATGNPLHEKIKWLDCQFLLNVFIEESFLPVFLSVFFFFG